jgi:hypothetical protein
MLLGMAQSGKESPNSKDVALLLDKSFSNGLAAELVALIKDEYAKADRARKIRMYDRLAKDEHVTRQIFERGRRHLRGALSASDGRRGRRPTKRAAPMA